MVQIKPSLYQVSLCLLAVIASLIAVESCRSGGDNQALNDTTVAAGQKLAQRYCSTCHMLVSPEALDKETWTKHVLPAMAPRLGLESYEGGFYYAGPKAVVSYDDWQKIVAYFETLAPAAVERTQPVVSAQNDWAIFSLEKPRLDTTKTAETTLVVMDTIGRHLYSGDGLRNDLTRWDQQLHPTVWKQLKSAPVNATFFRDKQGTERSVFTTLGTMMAEDITKGELIQIGLSEKQPADTSVIFANLPRPLQSIAADLNKDGLTDWLVCGFGHLAGGLYWLKQKPDHQFT
ncbi:MAG: VCBS repeat-containing protein, partial [Cytophagaceae bacterium]